MKEHSDAPRRARAEPLLEVRSLSVAFGHHGESPVVRDVELDLRPGEMLGIVGGSGSGKTTTMRAILGHLPRGAAVTSGEIRFLGSDLLTMPRADLHAIRGRRIAMIVQNPGTALNPVRTVGDQMRRLAAVHGRKLGRDELADYLRSAGIGDCGRALDAYPHELSGGMAQRVLIAIAISLEPDIILADEPTSALDVTIQAQIMELLRKMIDELGLAIVFVTHDIALVGEYCEHVAVMSGGRIVEQGTADDILYGPRDPYTQRLVDSARPLTVSQHPIEVTP